jgi:hypothetical protein
MEPHKTDETYAPDDKGREHPHTMTDRELLEEMVVSQRKLADLVNGFFDDFKNGRINPMKMMMGGVMGGRK